MQRLRVCMPGRIRTCDLQSRSLTLYPAELRALNGWYDITPAMESQTIHHALPKEISLPFFSW